MQSCLLFFIGFFLLIQFRGTTAASLPQLEEVRTTLERDLPPSTPMKDGESAQKPNASLALPSVLGQHVHIPFPIVNSTLTIIFTEMGDFAIPIDRVSNFFVEVLQNIQPSVERIPSRPINPHLWFFRSYNRRDGSILSISIYTHQSQTLSWLQLDKVLKGLQVFMSAHRRTLTFDIETRGHGVVADGLVWYSPPHSLSGNAEVKRAAGTNDPPPRMVNGSDHPPNSLYPTQTFSSPLSATTFYPVPSSPIVLKINPNGPPIPCIYIQAGLTNLLRRISRDDPNVRIPYNRFTYHDPSSRLAVGYLGYRTEHWITWWQLSWTLSGLLGFCGEREENCRAMAVENYVMNETEQEIYGGLIMWHLGDELPGNEA